MGITLWQSLSDRTEAMARDAMQDVVTPADWERLRPARQREFMRALGLDPLPGRDGLAVRECGDFRGQGFHARRLSIDILPECPVSACLYYPDPLPAEPAPGVLYVCGHGMIGTYHYQYHPLMWARRGYVCLIVDTVEQNDNPGEHHGSHMGREDTWLSLGYTPAGAEVWNAMRALDVLAADPHVDADRLGVTGVSGGGACSFHIAVADERLQAVSTLCGISSPLDAVANRHLTGHCDCMYPLNVYGRDISAYAALITPRAALFCFADHDTLYHPSETRDLVDRTRHVYRLLGRDEDCRIVTCPGPHGDHPAFDAATAEWFDRHVAGEAHPPLPRGERELPETTTSVFQGQAPQPNRLALLPHLVSPRGTVPLPTRAEDWPQIRTDAVATLRREVLHGVPQPRADQVLALDGDWQWSDEPASTRFRAHRGHVDGLDIWIHMVIPPHCRPKLVLSLACEGETSMHALNRASSSMDTRSTVYAGFQPRVAGFNSVAADAPAYPPGSQLASARTLLLRAMALTGTTPVMMTIDDLGAAVDYLAGLPEMQGFEIHLCGKGEGGVAALYYALLDERITGVVAIDAPSSHLDGAPILGILRAFDMPQAVGLMAPRKVALVDPGHSFWTWPNRVYERLGCAQRLCIATDLRQALDHVLA